ncbi:putative oxidoreductase YfjR [Podospora fimiseda]|uniref:Oxidoreductase YfjR n=1 Tax=Podospora fimiseda TaxID=252190 RepID=A0AAN7BXF2_9PEZI|nr:putative oxidoreductase YfjR [Podospora fimiseda]
MAPRLFWIGVGNMGRGMVKNLVEKGNLDQPLLIYNRTKQRSVELSESLPAGKSEVVDTIAEGSAKADIIFIILSKDDVVEAAAKEILDQGDVTGKLIVDSSTIHPDTTTRLAKVFVDRGAEFLAAPVFGAPVMADAGQLIGVLAGPASAVQRARPYFKGVMARAEIDMSDKPYGKALTLKLIGNTFIVNMVEQLAEAHVLAEKSGLGGEALHAWVEEMFPGPYAAYSSRMLSGTYYKRDPLFTVDLARKDAGHALSLAKEAGTRLRNVETADEHLRQLKEHVGEKGDIAGIYGAVRLEAGLKYENE